MVELTTFDASRAASDLPPFLPARSRLAPHYHPFTGTSPGGPIPFATPTCNLHSPRGLRVHEEVLTIAVMDRQFQDDLFAVNAATLRRDGVIKPGAASAVVCFGEGADALRREVKLWHRVWSHGRGLSLFFCPGCQGKAKILRLHDGRVQCRKCLMRAGIQFRIAYGSRQERAEAREKHIEKLRAQVGAGSLRAHPSGGRGVEGRRSLQMSLRRALVRQQEELIEEVEKWRGPPGR